MGIFINTVPPVSKQWNILQLQKLKLFEVIEKYQTYPNLHLPILPEKKLLVSGVSVANFIQCVSLKFFIKSSSLFKRFVFTMVLSVF